MIFAFIIWNLHTKFYIFGLPMEYEQAMIDKKIELVIVKAKSPKQNVTGP